MSLLLESSVAILASLRGGSDSKRLNLKHFLISIVIQGGTWWGAIVREVVVLGELFMGNCPGVNARWVIVLREISPGGNDLGSSCPGGLFGVNCWREGDKPWSCLGENFMGGIVWGQLFRGNCHWTLYCSLGIMKKNILQSF